MEVGLQDPHRRNHRAPHGADTSFDPASPAMHPDQPASSSFGSVGKVGKAARGGTFPQARPWWGLPHCSDGETLRLPHTPPGVYSDGRPVSILVRRFGDIVLHKHFYQADVVGKCEAEFLGTTGADAMARENPGPTHCLPNEDLDQRVSDADAHRCARR